MSYCVLADVQDLTQHTYSSTSRPSTTDVEGMIDEIAAEIDSVCASAGYTMPATGTSAVTLLKMYNKFGAAVQAWHAGVINDTDLPRVTYWSEQYQNFLTRMRDGDQALPGETPESAGAQGAICVPFQRVDGYSAARRI